MFRADAPVASANQASESEHQLTQSIRFSQIGIFQVRAFTERAAD